jgi:Tol biopolymer transport system component
MMPSLAALLERESATVDLDPGHFERLLRRRDRKRRNERIGAGVVAVGIALISFFALTRAFDGNDRTMGDPRPLKFTSTAITFTGDPRGAGDLVAMDPDTGDVRTLIDSRWFPGVSLIGSAAPSADGRWVAFQNVHCGGDASEAASPSGLWVTDGRGEPRQLMTKCPHPLPDLWDWAPVGAQLVVARRSVEGSSLLLIDAATGVRTDLGKAAGDVTSITWSPDGTRIAYGTGPPRGGSVYSVSVSGGVHSLLARSIGYMSGDGDSSIRWSPNGTHIAVAASSLGPGGAALYLMNADGSDLHRFAEGIEDHRGLSGSPGFSWSPDGTRLAYATGSGGEEDHQIQIWIGSIDGSIPSLLFESGPSLTNVESAGAPIWSPDGTQVAFGYAKTQIEPVWLAASADGSGDVREIEELRYLSWRGGWYFCGCYG